MNNTVKNASNSNSNSSSGMPWLLILVCVGLLVSGLVFYFTTQKESHPWYSTRISWGEYLFGAPANPEAAASPSVMETSTPLVDLEKRKSGIPTKPGETWCFLGEDNTGRWCVKVPMPSLCEPSRSYGGRDSCEMTLAQKLPLGLGDVVSRGPPRPPASFTIETNKQMAERSFALDKANTAAPSASLSKNE